MWARGEGEVGVDQDVRWKTSERNSRRKANWIKATSFRLAETESLQDIHKNHYSQSTCVVYSCTKRPKFLSKIQFLLIWFDGCKRECLFGWDLYGSLLSLSLSLRLPLLASVDMHTSLERWDWQCGPLWKLNGESRQFRLPWKSRIATWERLKTECSHSGATSTCKFHQKVQFKCALNASKRTSGWLVYRRVFYAFLSFSSFFLLTRYFFNSAAHSTCLIRFCHFLTSIPGRKRLGDSSWKVVASGSGSWSLNA
jgi:hypothetical protein